MPVMIPADRRELCQTLQGWLDNACAGVKCATKVNPEIIALIEAPDDKPEPPGGS